MNKLIKIDQDYKQWLVDIKERIHGAQIKASVAVNTEMLRLYWSMGEDFPIDKWKQGMGRLFLKM